VNPSYRNHKLGFKLKLAQRERVLTPEVKHITWTFDPLQSLNAHLNFGKLGVISDTYKFNFYGEKTSSFLHQIGMKNHLSLEIPWNINDRCASGRNSPSNGAKRRAGHSLRPSILITSLKTSIGRRGMISWLAFTF